MWQEGLVPSRIVPVSVTRAGAEGGKVTGCEGTTSVGDVVGEVAELETEFGVEGAVDEPPGGVLLVPQAVRRSAVAATRRSLVPCCARRFVRVIPV
jgi:hypothetical protein